MPKSNGNYFIIKKNLCMNVFLFFILSFGGFVRVCVCVCADELYVYKSIKSKYSRGFFSEDAKKKFCFAK